MRLELPTGTVREWRRADAPSLARSANDRRIWRNLRDRFPYPYSLADAEQFLVTVESMSPVTSFAIEVDGDAVGGIGYMLHGDVERVSAEVGYWLGVPFWGRGIMTAAVAAVTRHAFASHDWLRRLYAVPYAWSLGSIRVLEKSGYRREGQMRQSAIKDGEVTDQLLYAMLRDDVPSVEWRVSRD